MEEDKEALDYETDRLKRQSEQMNSDQIDLRGEAESLNIHMDSLNRQNKCLAKEL